MLTPPLVTPEALRGAPRRRSVVPCEADTRLMFKQHITTLTVEYTQDMTQQKNTSNHAIHTLSRCRRRRRHLPRCGMLQRLVLYCLILYCSLTTSQRLGRLLLRCLLYYRWLTPPTCTAAMPLAITPYLRCGDAAGYHFQRMLLPRCWLPPPMCVTVPLLALAPYMCHLLPGCPMLHYLLLHRLLCCAVCSYAAAYCSTCC